MILILVGLILGATMVGVGLAGLVWSVSGATWLVVIGAPLTLIALYRSCVSRRRDGMGWIHWCPLAIPHRERFRTDLSRRSASCNHEGSGRRPRAFGERSFNGRSVVVIEP
jgi:hypothetical protein